ncbi:hypothetical protein HPP92_018322 [Vanilla planifolia]|uniref:Uncharacterized protein n=1 Tax=Vanilla planifolia TaxID=51239 RepID=A0A835QCL0_VANPL|nr:hypothetical protein HPP92_018322 [Vanilla planifolia]
MQNSPNEAFEQPSSPPSANCAPVVGIAAPGPPRAAPLCAARKIPPRHTRFAPASSIEAKPTLADKFSAFTSLYSASPYYQFAHFTANQAITEAFEAEEHRNGGALHVVDLDVSHGFQGVFAPAIPSRSETEAQQASTPGALKASLASFNAPVSLAAILSFLSSFRPRRPLHRH